MIYDRYSSIGMFKVRRTITKEEHHRSHKQNQSVFIKSNQIKHTTIPDTSTLHYTTMTTASVRKINNFIHGKATPPSLSQYIPVLSPTSTSSSSSPIANVALSTKDDVLSAVTSSQTAFQTWSKLTIKSRASIMLKFHSLVKQNSQELAELIVAENGKNITEALADVAKGNETVEYACSLPQLAQGHQLQVSSAVACQDRRDPLGVIASIVPFNFPFMVPMWTLPIALVMGNTVVLKPSEKVPLTMWRVMDLLKEAGLPDGVVNVVNGGRECVEALIDHPDVRAITFVGSSPVAKLVKERCNNLHKRCVALGGAKNHLVALKDCDLEDTARDVVVSSAGCAGQRCMAASVLLLIAEEEGEGGSGSESGFNDRLMETIIEKASALEKGTGPGQLGPVIDQASYNKIHKYVNEAEANGAKILLDGRKWATSVEEGGCWVGPTIIMHSSKDDAAIKEEIFGPVLSVYVAKSWLEAMEIENSNPFGNAACIYTSSGGNAEWFTRRFRASMLGVNVGIPVPREPFSFGGLYGTRSKYGDMDITGDGAMEFFSNRIKVTTKWIVPKVVDVEDVVMNGNSNGHSSTNGPVDQANFAGTM